jgi:hypothetical protein
MTGLTDMFRHADISTIHGGTCILLLLNLPSLTQMFVCLAFKLRVDGDDDKISGAVQGILHLLTTLAALQGPKSTS